MNIFHFGILLRNVKDQTKSESIDFNSFANSYIDAWKEAAEFATEKLKEKSLDWYIEIIRNFV